MTSVPPKPSVSRPKATDPEPRVIPLPPSPKPLEDHTERHTCDCGAQVVALYAVGDTKVCDTCAPKLARQIRKLLMSMPAD